MTPVPAVGRLWGLGMVTACLHPHSGDTPRILLHSAATSVSGFLSHAEDDCRLQAGSQRLLIETEMRSEHKQIMRLMRFLSGRTMNRE